jgi:hypothetical protein
VRVDSNANVVGLAGGQILDFDDTRLLFADWFDNSVKIRDRATTSDTTILPAATSAWNYYVGFLTPTGAIVNTLDSGGFGQSVSEWRNGTHVPLPGASGYAVGLRYRAPYATWIGDTSTIYVRDVSAGTTSMVSQTAWNGAPYPAPNGMVTFCGAQPDGSIDPTYVVIDRAGELTWSPVRCVDSPIPDGTNFMVQSSLNSTPNGVFLDLVMGTPDGSATLGTARDFEKVHGGQVGEFAATAGGWWAYTVEGTGGSPNQVFRRSPDGTTELASIWTTPSYLEAIDPGGAVSLVNDFKVAVSPGLRYLAIPGTAVPVPMFPAYPPDLFDGAGDGVDGGATSNGIYLNTRSVPYGGRWYLIYGSTLLEFPSYSTDAGSVVPDASTDAGDDGGGSATDAGEDAASPEDGGEDSTVSMDASTDATIQDGGPPASDGGEDSTIALDAGGSDASLPDSGPAQSDASEDATEIADAATTDGSLHDSGSPGADAAGEGSGDHDADAGGAGGGGSSCGCAIVGADGESSASAGALLALIATVLRRRGVRRDGGARSSRGTRRPQYR